MAIFTGSVKNERSPKMNVDSSITFRLGLSNVNPYDVYV